MAGLLLGVFAFYCRDNRRGKTWRDGQVINGHVTGLSVQ